MTNAVFIHKADSGYDDLAGIQYHFPKQYLSRVEKTVGDWVVMWEPRSNGGRMAYHTVQKVESIIQDYQNDGYFYAIFDRASELNFDQSVPREIDGLALEQSLRGKDGRAMSGGNSVSAVRLISSREFNDILFYAYPKNLSPMGVNQSVETVDGFEDVQTYFEHPIVERLTKRKFRDAAFRRQVKKAYNATCAMSGLSLKNGGGRPEVEAAHIISVEDNGPDTVRNGLALSGTLHWMFDRGLIGVDEDYSIIISEDKIPKSTVERLIVPDRRLLLPSDASKRPHPTYLKHHREKYF
ncbi:MAG: HNH endonuclease [Amylibacter sp.]|nr:HNH endonuclease [Amylibacter sp.]